jgi:thiol-disulfide isomerase/thioredoxin
MRAVLLFVSICLFTISVSAQNIKNAPAKKTPVKVATKPVGVQSSLPGYAINVKITPLKNSWLYLYNYYGKYYQLADSIMLNDKSEGVFKGSTKLNGGIYMIVTERRVRLFDVLMDDNQHFSIVGDTLHPDKPIITGSPENTLYQDYTRFLEREGPKLNMLQRQLAEATTKEDSAAKRKQIADANKVLQNYRDNVIKNNSKSMLAAFFNAMKTPEYPEMPKKANGTLDSTYPFRYVQEHYWDDVAFNDDRLVRTPPQIFEDKLDGYFKFYVSPEPDSIIDKVKYMLLYSRDAKEMYRYLLAKFTNKYINPEIMGQDKVFVYLFENFYLKGDTTILSDKDKKTVMERGWSLIANQLGEPAPLLNLVTAEGKHVNLYDVNAPYTFVIFWDPNCGHCKETVPRVDSIWEAKWKGLGMKIYAVNIDEKANKAWGEFITKNNLGAWTNVYQTKEEKDEEAKAGKPNFRQLYDVYKTPTLYLLDEQKRIIAKNLDVSGFDAVLDAKVKKQAKK